MELALREELALMRNELVTQARTIAENAAELNRMQLQIQQPASSAESKASSSNHVSSVLVSGLPIEGIGL